MRRKRQNKIAKQFSWRTIEMMESPAYQALSLTGHRILARVEIELAHHGGQDNGQLPVTFDQFAEYAIHRHAIAPGLREVCALGFLEVTERGRAGNAEWRRPNMFRLTYRPVGSAKPTDEWQRIKTIEDAERIASRARTPIPRPRVRRTLTQEYRGSDGFRTMDSSDGFRTMDLGFSVPETALRNGRNRHWEMKMTDYVGAALRLDVR